MVVGAVMLFFGVNYLKGFNPLAQQDHFYGVYDKIEGLAVSNPVLVNGYKVGQVTRVEFHNTGDGSLLVEFTVDHSELDIPIKWSTSFTVMNRLFLIHYQDLLIFFLLVLFVSKISVSQYF